MEIGVVCADLVVKAKAVACMDPYIVLAEAIVKANNEK